MSISLLKKMVENSTIFYLVIYHSVIPVKVLYVSLTIGMNDLEDSVSW